MVYHQLWIMDIDYIGINNKEGVVNKWNLF